MLEPQIKYENCEEIYTGPGPSNAGEQQQNTRGDNRDDVGFGSATVPALQKRNYNEHLQSMMSENPTMADAYNNSGAYPIAPHMGGNNYFGMQQPQQRKPQANPIKRRRYETNLLFQHPFFNLLEDWDSARSGETITAKCLSCKVTLRGHKNVSSNFIKHMKRLHPELYKVYENYKLLKFQGWNPVDGTSSGAIAEQPYFDHSAFLEQIASTTGEDHNSTEASSTPPTDVLEVIEGKAYTQALDDSTQNISEAGDVGSSGGAGGVRLVSQDRIFDRKQSRAEVDLSSRTLQQMSQMLDSKLNGFVTIAQLQEERKTMLELIDTKLEENLSNSHADDNSVRERKTDTPTTTTTAASADTSIQSQLDNLKRECEQLRAAVQKAHKSKQSLQSELEAIDRTMRQRKIFVRNMPAILGEKPKQAAERLMRDHLQLPEVHVKQIFLLTGQNNMQKNKLNMVLELQKAQDANDIMKNCVKLKNTGIVVEHALGPHALRRKHKLLVLRKEILRRNAKLKVLVRNTQMIVGGKQFHWDFEDGLCREGEVDDVFDTSGCSAVQQLKEVTKLDMQEFLNVLKNYDVK